MIKLKIALALGLSLFPLFLIVNTANASQCSTCCYRCCDYTTNMPLACRVTRKLRANISTCDQPIHVAARNHTIILYGRIGTCSQRWVAIEIARNTCGVCLVIDRMHLAEP